MKQIAMSVVISVLAIPHAVWADEKFHVSMAGMANNIRQSYGRFSGLNNLYVKYNFTYEYNKGPKNFVLDSATIETRRSGDQRRLQFEGVRGGKNTPKSIYAWDGKVCRVLENNDFTMSKTIDTRLYLYDFYMNMLQWPDAEGKIPAMQKGTVKAAKTWLPAAVTDHKSQCVVKKSTEPIDGDACVVVEQKGRDVWWFDPQKGWALRRREIYNAETGRLQMRVTTKDLVTLGGVWMPKSVVQEEFAVRTEGNVTAGDTLSPKNINVSDINMSKIPNSAFVLTAPVGITVHDLPNKRYFTYSGEGEIPVVRSAELAQKKYGRKTYGVGLIVAIGLSIVCMCAVIVAALLRKTSVQ